MTLENIMDQMIQKTFPTISEIQKIQGDEEDKKEEKQPYEGVREDLKRLRIENERLENENERFKIENERLENENKYRDRFVEWTIKITTAYLFCAGIFVVFNTGASDIIKGVVLGSALITIIGLPKIIIEGLFENKDKKDK